MFGSLHEDRVNRVVAAFNKKTLREDSRKEIMSYADPRCRARAKRQGLHARYKGVIDDSGTIQIDVTSGTISGHWWTCLIRFKNVERAIEILKERKPDIRDLAITRALMEGDIEMSCSCPAWTYWGWAYRATQHGYGIGVENRAPKRNLAYSGSSLCKHGILALQVLPFYTSRLVGEFRARGLLPNRSKQKDNSNGKES